MRSGWVVEVGSRRSFERVALLATLALHLAFAAPAGADELKRQTQGEADRKSAGCLSCHVGIEPMHESKRVKLGCTDCHGGNAGVSANGAEPGSDAYVAARDEAHVQPEPPERWVHAEAQPRSANPVRRSTLRTDEPPRAPSV